ncbi:hypothetical protein [Roseateles chitinivorans]|uniref:hypothetical protein n=1 Tax=Roseateles chitinivorans TaxID=2917965 RepID=UPI003D67E911
MVAGDPEVQSHLGDRREQRLVKFENTVDRIPRRHCRHSSSRLFGLPWAQTSLRKATVMLRASG